MNPTFRTEAGTLVVQMPAQGIDPSCLARPLPSPISPSDASALRVEAADDWRWGSVEAAFLARVVRELGREISEPALVGVPSELRKLLALAAVRPRLTTAQSLRRTGSAVSVRASDETCAR